MHWLQSRHGWCEGLCLVKRLEDVDPSTLGKLSHPLHAMDPFFAHDIPLLAGEHVTDDAGTGFVHTAPAHGEDDFNVWVESGRTTQEIRQIVDPDGCYTPDVPRFAAWTSSAPAARSAASRARRTMK
jgi:isoleucyl-tRNA synthetase